MGIILNYHNYCKQSSYGNTKSINHILASGIATISRAEAGISRISRVRHCSFAANLVISQWGAVSVHDVVAIVIHCSILNCEGDMLLKLYTSFIPYRIGIWSNCLDFQYSWSSGRIFRWCIHLQFFCCRSGSIPSHLLESQSQWKNAVQIECMVL